MYSSMAAGLSKLLRQGNHRAPASARRKRHRVRRLNRAGNPDSITSPENSVTVPTSCGSSGFVVEEGDGGGSGVDGAGGTRPRVAAAAAAGGSGGGASGGGPDIRREVNSVRFIEDSYGSPSEQRVTLPGMIPDGDSSPSPPPQPKPRAVPPSVKPKVMPSHKHKAVAGPSKWKPAGQGIPSAHLEDIPQPTKKYVSNIRSRRVMKEFQAARQTSQTDDKPLFDVCLDEDNLYEWMVKLLKVDPTSSLHGDMKATGTTSIDFNVSFPDNFPFSPPFVRLTAPRIENGYVLDGGAICMELLTPQGWSSSYTMEAVILQLGATLVAGHARISPSKKRLFGEIPLTKQEAIESFNSIVETHKRYGWLDPPGELS